MTGFDKRNEFVFNETKTNTVQVCSEEAAFLDDCSHNICPGDS